jgi:hypothetical protein
MRNVCRENTQGGTSAFICKVVGPLLSNESGVLLGLLGGNCQTRHVESFDLSITPAIARLSSWSTEKGGYRSLWAASKILSFRKSLSPGKLARHFATGFLGPQVSTRLFRCVSSMASHGLCCPGWGRSYVR